jgi:uncharacterized lipoprotein YmbA
MNLRLVRHAPVLLLTAVLLVACLPSARPPAPVLLYTLQPARQERLAADFADFTEMILILPVRLAPQLQERGLVVRRADGGLRTAPGHLWAGPLDEQIGASLAAGLRDLLGTEQVAVFPGPRFAVTRYQVEVEVTGFSGDAASFTLQAVYTVSDALHRRMLARRAFQQTLPVEAPDHAGTVTAAARAVDGLSREVAAALLAARRSPQPGVPAHAP